MATRAPITLREFNDETLIVAVSAAAAGYDLTDVDAVEFYLKASACDADASALVLSSADPDEITITSQTVTGLAATISVPPLAGSYDRFYRVDALTGLLRRTALYGPVTVVNL